MNAWKPGDVAIARWRYFPGVPAIYTARGWIDIDNAEFDGDEDDLTLRPLVVIDPEDAEQVRRLSDLIDDAGERLIPADDWNSIPFVDEELDTAVMTDALREFANPTPRIEEPTGLGAVVEDGEGRRFVLRCDCDNDEARNWWPSRANDRFNGVVWADIKAVRVLSHGVTQDS